MQNLEAVVLTGLGLVITEMATRDKENYINIEEMYMDITKKLFETSLKTQYIKIIEMYLQQNLSCKKQDIINCMKNELIVIIKKDLILESEEDDEFINLFIKPNEIVYLEYSKYIEEKYKDMIKDFIQQLIKYEHK